MILEAVILPVKAGQEDEFEAAFKQASPIIASMKGYIQHELHRCIETPNRYLLLVHWEYQEWKRLLHHFYDPFPVVEHFQNVDLTI
jgi:heme-degrading monooxygenase HmoA